LKNNSFESNKSTEAIFRFPLRCCARFDSSSFLSCCFSAPGASLLVLFSLSLPKHSNRQMSSYSSFKSASKKVRGLSPLDRRTPRNNKYSNVKSTLDTGNSMSKVELITARQYLRRRDELFKRVGPATCQELIEDYQDQTETIFAMGQDVEEEEEQKQDAEQATSLFMSGPVSPSSEPVIRQNNAEQYNGGVYNESNERAPFLFLDVREKQDYNACHIACARSFPANNLKHDKISPELYHYKNRDGYVIVLYDMDDRMGRNVATMFTEKGYENIFLLTGGLDLFATKCPTLVEGRLPEANEGKENKSKRDRGGRGNKGTSSKPKQGIGGRPPRPGKTRNTTEYTEIGGVMSFDDQAQQAKSGAPNGGGAASNKGRPPRAPRSGRKGGHQELTTENVRANERAMNGTPGTPGKKGTTPSKRSGRGRAPSQAGSTVSRADTLLSWNQGNRRNQTSL
jgi:centrosomal protein CEP41